MNKILSLLLLLISMVGSASAQKAQPIWQPVFTNRITTGTSSPVKNVGQSFHQVYALFANSGGVCYPLISSLRLEGSYDNTNYIPFTPLVAPAWSTFSSSLQFMGVGTFPFVRVNLMQLDGNCSVNVYYSGSTDGAVNPQVQVGASLGYIPDFATSNVGTIFLTSYNNTPTGTRNVIYMLDITVAASANPVTVEIQGANAAGACASGEPVMYQVTLAANTTLARKVVFPFAPAPYFTSPRSGLGNGICLYTTVGETVSTYTLYRKE